jgi:heptaprenyl diphosphate synthase
MLSISGGIAALLVMMAAKSSKLGFSIYGISIAGAVLHNLTQLALVKYTIIPNVQVFVLTPILLLLGMVSGIVVAYLTLIFRDKIKDLRLT